MFGHSRTGNTQVVSALGHELVRQGHSVLFTPATSLVERLLQVKHQSRFRRELPTLDTIKCQILDDEKNVDASHPSLTERLPTNVRMGAHGL